MGEVIRFYFQFQRAKTPIRVVTINGEPWFVAVDLARALDRQNSRRMLQGLPDDEKGVTQSYANRGIQWVSIVNESGLYRIVARSDKPQAKPFQDWVFRDVIPQIHRTGRYEIVPAAPMPELLEKDHQPATIARNAHRVGRTGRCKTWGPAG